MMRNIKLFFIALTLSLSCSFLFSNVASAKPGVGGVDLMLGIGAQACHGDLCEKDFFDAGPMGSLSIGYVFDFHKYVGAGIFADFDLGGMTSENYKSSFTFQGNAMAKFFFRIVFMDLWLGVGGGYSFYSATFDSNLKASWSWKGPSLKATAGFTIFLPVLPSLGLGLDYAYIHSFEGSYSGALSSFSFTSSEKRELFDLSQVKFHLRFNF